VVERIREWYAKFWPEGALLVEERTFLTVLTRDPTPKSVFGNLKEEEPGLYDKAKENIIPEIEDGLDLSGISALASLAISLWDAREKMEDYLEREMRSNAPALSEIAGPLIGARLIHSAGGLERLSRLPSSTVQVLGAEKMFFKFLKEGGKPPKHGVLFQHPWVHSLPVQKRGKMARSLASAASLASRMDAYGGGDPSPLKEKIEKRAKQVREMEVEKRSGGGRQPPFREGWWANKHAGKGKRKRGRRKR
jgi:nucleolar protein 56